MSPSKAEFYRRQAEACCRNAIVVDDIGRRLHWLETAARWISLGREEGDFPPRRSHLAGLGTPHPWTPSHRKAARRAVEWGWDSVPAIEEPTRPSRLLATSHTSNEGQG